MVHMHLTLTLYVPLGTYSESTSIMELPRKNGRSKVDLYIRISR